MSTLRGRRWMIWLWTGAPESAWLPGPMFTVDNAILSRVTGPVTVARTRSRTLESTQMTHFERVHQRRSRPLTEVEAVESTWDYRGSCSPRPVKRRRLHRDAGAGREV